MSRIALATCLIAGLGVTALQAQRHAPDEPRLVFGFSGGWIGGTNLWRVDGQIFVDCLESTTDLCRNPTYDTLSLSRTYSAGFTFNAHVVDFIRPHVGLTAEFNYLGLGATDGCTPIGSDPCSVTDQHRAGATATMFSAGMTYRLSGRTALQPYITALGGLAVVPHNPDALEFDFPPAANDQNPLDSGTRIVAWPDLGWSEFRPAGTLGIGLWTAPSRGFQFRVEARETWISLSQVTGPIGAPYFGLMPPTMTTWKGFPSLLLGVDILLQKNRTLRY